MEQARVHRGPSRKMCEETIKRILMTEVLEQGTNHHFKNASDFMHYFESLYPASPGLTKQVQRAVKALDMPKDKNGYFIINKTKEQLDKDDEISFTLKKAEAMLPSMEGDFEILFLQTNGKYRDHLMTLIQESESFRDKYLTMIPSSEGVLFLTRNKSQLTVLLNSLM